MASAGLSSDATRRRGPRWAWRGLCLVLGATYSLIFPEAGWWWYAYVGLAPVLVLVAAAATWRDALWRSWAAGTGFFVGLHQWMLGVLGPFVVPVGLGMGATWIPVGLVAWATLAGARSPARSAAAMALVPSVWVLSEVVRSWDALGGSWGYIGLSQWSMGPVLAVAALGGVWALSALLVVTNTALAIAVRADIAVAVRVASLGAAAALVAVGVGWGMVRGDAPVDGHLRIAGVQPGKIDDPEERLAANERLTAQIDVPVDVIVWGQSSVGFDPVTDRGVRERLEAVADQAGTDVLVNVDARRPDGRIAKSTMVFRPGVGLDDEYDKQRLVPFGEYIPLRPVFGWVADFTDAAAEDRVPGGDLTLITTGDVDMGPLISYESTFPDLRRTLAGMGAELTVVQGASTTFQGTWAQPQQASFEAVRAVESGRPAVLVTVSGTSAAFDARGRELAWVPSDVTGWFAVEVPLSQEATPFVRYGDWVPALSLAVVLAAAATILRQRWIDRHPTERSER